MKSTRQSYLARQSSTALCGADHLFVFPKTKFFKRFVEKIAELSCGGAQVLNIKGVNAVPVTIHCISGLLGNEQEKLCYQT